MSAQELFAIPDYTHDEIKDLLAIQINEAILELCGTFPEVSPAELIGRALAISLASNSDTPGHIWWMDLVEEIQPIL